MIKIPYFLLRYGILKLFLFYIWLTIQTIKTVPNNYHVEYDHHYYSVPYTYYKQEVTLKASYFDIIICDSMNHLICTHKRCL